MSEQKEILVLGVGNILRRDDGVGVRVVGHLMRSYAFSPNVRLLDGGTFGRHLAPEILKADAVIVVDTLCAGKTPGTVSRLDSATAAADGSPAPENYVAPDAPGSLPETVVFGVEPGDREPWGTELTPSVDATFREVVSLVLAEIRKAGGTCRPRRCRNPEELVAEPVAAAS